VSILFALYCLVDLSGGLGTGLQPGQWLAALFRWPASAGRGPQRVHQEPETLSPTDAWRLDKWDGTQGVDQGAELQLLLPLDMAFPASREDIAGSATGGGHKSSSYDEVDRLLQLGTTNVTGCYYFCATSAPNWCSQLKEPVLMLGPGESHLHPWERDRKPKLNGNALCDSYCTAGCTAGARYQLDCPRLAVHSCINLGIGPTQAFKCSVAAIRGCLNAWALPALGNAQAEERALRCSQECGSLTYDFCDVESHAMHGDTDGATRRLDEFPPGAQPEALGNRFASSKHHGCRSGCNVGCGYGQLYRHVCTDKCAADSRIFTTGPLETLTALAGCATGCMLSLVDEGARYVLGEARTPLSSHQHHHEDRTEAQTAAREEKEHHSHGHHKGKEKRRRKEDSRRLS